MSGASNQADAQIPVYSSFGLPLSNLAQYATDPAGNSQQRQHFEGGYIYWQPAINPAPIVLPVFTAQSCPYRAKPDQ